MSIIFSDHSTVYTAHFKFVLAPQYHWNSLADLFKQIYKVLDM